MAIADKIMIMINNDAIMIFRLLIELEGGAEG